MHDRKICYRDLKVRNKAEHCTVLVVTFVINKCSIRVFINCFGHVQY